MNSASWSRPQRRIATACARSSAAPDTTAGAARCGFSARKHLPQRLFEHVLCRRLVGAPRAESVRPDEHRAAAVYVGERGLADQVRAHAVELLPGTVPDIVCGHEHELVP